MIRVPIHPEFGTSLPMIEADCLIAECDGECVSFCPTNALKLIELEQSIQFIMKEKWMPVTVLLEGDL